MYPFIFFSMLVALDAPPRSGPSAAFLELEKSSPAVRNGRLVEDLGIETLGGVFTPLLSRNQVVPVEKTETFSTAADNQEQIEIRLLRGIRRLARDNHLVGRFVVYGIPKSPRGKVNVAVTFSITADGTIRVEARERSGHRVGVRRTDDHVSP